MQSKKTALFVSYNALTEPIVRSQVLPYIYGLSGKGVKFHLITFEKNSRGSEDAAKTLKDNGVAWIPLKFHSRPVALAKMADIMIGSFAVLSCLIRYKIGIVHSRGIITATMALVWSKCRKAKFVFDMKSSLAEAYRLSGRLKVGSVTYRLLSFIERTVISLSDEVIVETSVHRSEILRDLGKKRSRPSVTVIPCCVDIERFALSTDAHKLSPVDGIRLIYLGSISGWYMINEMLDLFKVIKRSMTGSEFIFLTHDRSGDIERLAAERCVKDVKVISADYEEVPLYLRDATAGILFKKPNARLDSFPIKIGEYLAAGLPVLINKGMGDVEDIIRNDDVGVIISDTSTAAYEEGVSSLKRLLYEKDNLSKRCANAARDHLSYDRCLIQYYRIYNIL